jgi:hypothetical protein
MREETQIMWFLALLLSALVGAAPVHAHTNAGHTTAVHANDTEGGMTGG